MLKKECCSITMLLTIHLNTVSMLHIIAPSTERKILYARKTSLMYLSVTHTVIVTTLSILINKINLQN